MVFRPPHHEKPKEWPSIVVGWLFLIAGACLIAFIMMSSKPAGRLVCDTQGRPPSLTRFGTCRSE